jgi:hypothetical protein
VPGTRLSASAALPSLRSLGRFERTTVGVAGGAMALVALGVLLGRAPVAWLMLGVVGAVAVAVLVVQVGRERYFEPLTVLGAVVLLSFVVRPLYLFLNVDDLHSFYHEDGVVESLLHLENQEIALFVTRDLREPLEPALTRAMGAVALFVCLAVAGLLLPAGRRLADRLARAGQGSAAALEARFMTIACLVIAAIGQIAMLGRVGGPAAAADQMLDQAVLNTGVPYQVLLGFGTIGLLVWVAWSPPRTALARAGFAAATAEICLFYALAGTRTRIFLTLFMIAVVTHYLIRRWRLREVVGGLLVVLVISSGLLGVRQATKDESLGSALRSAPTYLTDPRGVLNDITEFDGLFYATTVIGSSREYRNPAPFRGGGWFIDALHSYVPASIDAGKPKSGDIEFRELVFDDEFEAGRPFTVIGDFWADFGFAGVALGALLVGVLMRGLVGLVAGAPRRPGSEYRVILYSIALVVFYAWVVNTYSVAIGFAITFGIPFLAVMHFIRPARERLVGHLAAVVGRTRKTVA